jgi:beta-N-acetylhexosaminidase
MMNPNRQKGKRNAMNKYIKLLLILLILFAGGYFIVMKYRASELDRMTGQMILVGFRGTNPNDASVKDVADDIRRGKIGGIILFSFDVAVAREAGVPSGEIRKLTKSRNILDVAQVRELNKYLSNAATQGGNPPLFISIDQEGGVISRLGPEHGFHYGIPSAKDMAKNKTPAQVRDLYYGLGLHLHSLGFNVNFAPVVDIDVNPDSPAIGGHGRAFSGNPERVIEYASAAARGLSDAGVIYSYKHFPGHGSAASDTHAGLTDVTKVWSDVELLPYRALAGTDMPGMVMVAHVFNENIDAEFPASLSEKTIDGILRRDIGFDGVVITDELQMGAIYKQYDLRETLKRAILAGNDIMLLGNSMHYTENIGRIAHGLIIDMVRRGEIPRRQIKKSYERIVKLKNNLQSQSEWGEHIDGVIDKLPNADGKKVIALTLDLCGGAKGAGFDSKLAKYFKDNGIRVTIFVNKRWIDKNEKEFMELAQSEFVDIQNHGTLHKPASVTGREAWGIKGFNSEQELTDEIKINEEHIYELTGRRTNLYRSGTAFYETAAMRIIRELGYKVIGFSINGDFGASVPAAGVEQNMLRAKSGDIIIDHLNHPESGVREGMLPAIEKLKAQGYEFVFVKDYLD